MIFARCIVPTCRRPLTAAAILDGQDEYCPDCEAKRPPGAGITTVMLFHLAPEFPYVTPSYKPWTRYHLVFITDEGESVEAAMARIERGDVGNYRTIRTYLKLVGFHGLHLTDTWACPSREVAQVIRRLSILHQTTGCSICHPGNRIGTMKLNLGYHMAKHQRFRPTI